MNERISQISDKQSFWKHLAIIAGIAIIIAISIFIG
jgi:hypothetical protein